MHKDEYPPLFGKGFHSLTFERLYAECVLAFPGSVRRPEIMAGFEVIVEQMSRVGIEGDIWIDGSFLTTKMEPDDIDLLLVIAEHHIGSLSRDQHDFVEWIQSSDRDPKLSLLCDPDLVFRLPSELEWYDHHCGSILRHYEHIYGRSVVAGEPKGIVVLSVTKSLPPPRTLSTPASTGLEPDLTQTKSESKGKE